MVEYVAMAKASLAWMHGGEITRPEKLATKRSSYGTEWRIPYGFDWMALARSSRSRCIGRIAPRNRICAGLLVENQHPCRKAVKPIRKACDEWHTGAQENATAEPCLCYEGARQLSYL